EFAFVHPGFTGARPRRRGRWGGCAMNFMNSLRILGLIGPVVGLFLLGLVLIVQSGVMELQSGRGLRQAVENLSQAVLLILGCLPAVASAQPGMGSRWGLW